MSNTTRTRFLLTIAMLIVAAIGLAGPASAFAPPAEDIPASGDEAAPWPAVPEEAQRRVPADKPGDEDGVAEFIAPPPDDIIIDPIPTPSTTLPPKIDRTEFGVGWPAVAAVGVALLAVLVMAQMWRRDGA